LQLQSSYWARNSRRSKK